MRKDDATTPALAVCTDCHEPFVVPISVLDVIDDGRCVVELHCTNCEETRIGVHTDEDLEALDQELTASREAMLNALEVLDTIDEWERAERFIEALHAGLITPDDF